MATKTNMQALKDRLGAWWGRLMGVLNPDGVDPQPNINRDLVTPLPQTAGKESGSAKRRRKAIERRDYWNNEENNHV